MKFLSKYKTEVFIFSLIAVVYFVLRLPNLTLQPIFADEAIYIRWAQVMRAEPTLRFLPLSDGKTPFFMWVMIPFLKIFSDPLFAGRFLSVLAGFSTLLGVFFLTKYVFNIKAALWAAVLYTITPYTVFFDRMALVDSMLASFNIWAIYIALWLVRAQRLDLAMILGYLLGGGLLTKTPAMVNVLVLPFTLLGLKKNSQNRYPFIKALGYLAISALIALVIYNLLRLGPGFSQLSSRNADYIFSMEELKGRWLDPFIPHFHDMLDWFPRLYTLPTLLLIGIGIYQLLFTVNRLGMVMLIWILIPVLLEMAFLKTFTARYLLSSVAPLLIFGGFGLTKALEKIKINNNLKIGLALLAILPLALRFDYQLVKNPPPSNLPKEERMGYFEDWTAGYGLKQIANYLIMEKGKNKDVVVGTSGFFGTLPDGLQIYLDKSNIAVVGSAATVSAQIRNAAKDHQTFFVGNKKELEGSIKNVKLILEFEKATPVNGKPDSTVLYQVLPQ